MLLVLEYPSGFFTLNSPCEDSRVHCNGRIQNNEILRLQTVRYFLYNNIVNINATITVCRSTNGSIGSLHLDSDILTCSGISAERNHIRRIGRRSRLNRIYYHESSRICRIGHNTYIEGSIIIRRCTIRTSVEFQTHGIERIHLRQNRILVFRGVSSSRAAIVRIETQVIIRSIRSRRGFVNCRIIVIRTTCAGIDIIPAKREQMTGSTRCETIKAFLIRELCNRSTLRSPANRVAELRSVVLVAPSGYADIVYRRRIEICDHVRVRQDRIRYLTPSGIIALLVLNEPVCLITHRGPINCNRVGGKRIYCQAIRFEASRKRLNLHIIQVEISVTITIVTRTFEIDTYYIISVVREVNLIGRPISNTRQIVLQRSSGITTIIRDEDLTGTTRRVLPTERQHSSFRQ